jgi:DNA end-binding protein Ku
MPATVWKGFLSFGLVSFPVRLFSAARAETVHFHMLHKKDKSRLKEVWYCLKEDKPIDRRTPHSAEAERPQNNRSRTAA